MNRSAYEMFYVLQYHYKLYICVEPRPCLPLAYSNRDGFAHARCTVAVHGKQPVRTR